MLRFLCAVLAVLTVLCNFCLGGSVLCNVVKVIDGDTLIASDQTGKNYTLKLYGIDAPQSEQNAGSKATQMLTAMIKDKDVTVVVVGKDNNGLPYVKLLLNGVSVNAAMVKSGYAWVNTDNCKDSQCDQWSQYQRLATDHRKGLWEQLNPEPPWVWLDRRARATAIAQQMKEANEEAYYDMGAAYSDSNSSSSSSEYDPRKTQSVSSYTRKDGTVVQGYKRRPPR
jgi:endonuclease YncB( thermonuclease family)